MGKYGNFVMVARYSRRNMTTIDEDDRVKLRSFGKFTKNDRFIGAIANSLKKDEIAWTRMNVFRSCLNI